MDSFKVIFIFVIINILESFAQLSLQEKLNLLMRLRRANDQSKFPTIFNKIFYNDVRNMMKEDNARPNRRSFVIEEVPDSTAYVLRRMYDFHPGMRSPIIASPTMPNQLPEAEAILPGHTLLRPALGMLKSAVKFPHKDMDDGAGVYGNLDNLGITYGGTSERVLYTGFRRNYNNFNDGNDNPTLLVALLRQGPEREEKPALRYIDYGKRERERKKRKEEEKLLQEREKNNFVPQGAYYFQNRLGTDGYKVFFDMPRLKLEAMQKENYHDSIKPYRENIIAPHQNSYDESRIAGIKLYS